MGDAFSVPFILSCSELIKEKVRESCYFRYLIVLT